MGLFGHGGLLSDMAHSIEHYAKEYIGGGYVGYNSNSGIVTNPYGTGQNQFDPDIFNENITQPGITNQYPGQPQINKPVAYTANAAKTASSIKQGGMTKQEIQDFNAKHPNESAWRQS